MNKFCVKIDIELTAHYEEKEPIEITIRKYYDGGEKGDIKNVANGYARNFLLPRNLAVPYNEATVAIFENDSSNKRSNSSCAISVVVILYSPFKFFLFLFLLKQEYFEGSHQSLSCFLLL